MKVPEDRLSSRGGAIRGETYRLLLDTMFKGRRLELFEFVEKRDGLVYKSSVTGQRCSAGAIIRDKDTGELFFVGKILFRRLRIEYDMDYKPRRPGRPIGSKSRKTIMAEREYFLDQLKWSDDFFINEEDKDESESSE